MKATIAINFRTTKARKTAGIVNDLAPCHHYNSAGTNLEPRE